MAPLRPVVAKNSVVNLSVNPLGERLFGPIPTMRPTDLLTLQRKCIRWASGEVIITVDPWDLNADDPEVGRIQKLNLGQVV